MSNAFDLLLPGPVDPATGVTLRYGLVTQVSPPMVLLERDPAPSYINSTLVSLVPDDAINQAPVLVARNGERLVLLGRLNDQGGWTGSNANGVWERTPSGIQRCWLTRVTTNQAIPYAYGSLWQGIHYWTYPLPFIENPVLTVGRAQWDTSASWGTPVGTTTTQGQIRLIDGFQRATGSNCYIEAMVVGKWR